MLKVTAGSLLIVCGWIPLLVSGDAGAQQVGARLPGVFAEVTVDVEVVDVTVTAPASAFGGVPFDVTVSASLRNNGPFGPINIPVDLFLSSPDSVLFPADCTKIPGGPFETATVPLEVGTIVPVSEAWSVACTGTGVHEFSVRAHAAAGAQGLIGTPDFSDVNPDNNLRERTVAVTVGLSPAAQPVTGGAPPLPGQLGVPAAYSLATAFAAILMMGLGAGVFVYRLRRK
ncbi:MAG: hypothetical protein Q7R32_11505 [Dehalococcoidia bacterium]|nr:hypothetical protein [Dehalococcoidia bacterium]